MSRLAALVVAGALAVAVALVAGGAWAGPARIAANSVTFPDSTGEDPAAPDVTSITVSNNDAGLITFQISIPNRPTLTSDMLVQIVVDTDGNPATGDPDALGADYLISLATGPNGATQIFLGRWTGTGYGDTPQTSLIFSYASGATVRVSANELGATKRFNFAVVAASGIVIDANGNPDFTNAKNDLAPDPGHGFYTYDVKTAPLALVVKTFGRAPLSPKAGGSLTVSLVAARSDTGATIKSGTVTCKATVAFKPVPARVHKVSAGKAICTFPIPMTAKGKTIRGTITLQFEGLTAKRSFSAKIM